jgi:lipid II:glycine glycyltransferase (peptidoglycan interpeptide bridge formation enzyme)
MNPSVFQVEIDSATESEWSRRLDHFEDANIYQTWSYGSIRWSAKNLSHLLLTQAGEVVAMAQLRIVRPKNFRMGIAYLRWGPMCQLRKGDLDQNIVRAMADALRQEYVERRGLYLEILPNAFCGSPRGEVFESAFTGFNREIGLSRGKYRTFVVDLQPSIEDLRKKLDKKWRNQLNAAERNELQITVGGSVKDYDVFCKLYDQMWEKKRFETTVSTQEFRRIQEQLPTNQRMKILISHSKGEPVGGLIYSSMGDSAIYLLGATNDTGRNLKAAYLMQWSVIQSLKDTGVRNYDLGGIDPVANPGVYHFKAGMSGADVAHMSPLVACDSILSATFVKAGHVVRGGLRRIQLRFGHA